MSKLEQCSWSQSDKWTYEEKDVHLVFLFDRIICSAFVDVAIIMIIF